MLTVLMIIGSAAAADHIIERSVIKGVGYRSHELFGQTTAGYSGQKISKSISGSGSFYDKTEFELDAIGNRINYTQDAQFDYFPTSYQTGTYDRKWTDKLSVANYDIGAVAFEDYTNAEHIQKSTEVRTSGNDTSNDRSLMMHINSNIIGVAHIGWVSKDTKQDGKGKYVEIGRSTEDLSGTFSVEKYIELLQNSTDYEARVDWLPCS
jgi:hypothetical protein